MGWLKKLFIIGGITSVVLQGCYSWNFNQYAQFVDFVESIDPVVPKSVINELYYDPKYKKEKEEIYKLRDELRKINPSTETYFDRYMRHQKEMIDDIIESLNKHF